MLQVVATTRPAAVHSKPATASLTAPPSRHSPTIHQQPTPLRHLRKLLPFSFRRRDAVLPVRNDRPRDPLDVCHFILSPTQPTHRSPYSALLHHLEFQATYLQQPSLRYVIIPSKMIQFRLTLLQLEPTTVPPISKSSTSTTIRSRLVRQLSNWWPMRTGNALPPIVEVPLAPGRLVS